MLRPRSCEALDMADRVDFYFRQRVTEAELDLAFELLERADRNFASDIGVYGVVNGAVPAPHSPVPDLSIDLTAPGRAYDNLGQRIFFGTAQTVDCSVDLAGVPTTVPTLGRERWTSVFLRFKRLLSDPRSDGNSQQVFFRRDESFELVIRQAPDGPAGLAPRPLLEPDELLVCDVRRRPGQTQIVAADIDIIRRQAFVFAQGTAVAISRALWTILSPDEGTVQAALDQVDAVLVQHFTAVARRHRANAIDYTPHGFVASGNVQSALNELVDGLGASTGETGASRIGAPPVLGAPASLTFGTVDGQLSELLGIINTHANVLAGAHRASAITANAFAFLSATNVQAQLEEIVDALSSTFGAAQIGIADGAAFFDSTQVEDALSEIAAAFDDDHFRENEAPNAGMHRTIRQPVMGSGKVLLWDAQGTGIPVSRMRVYADDNSVWFMFNARWNGDAWERDLIFDGSGGFRVGNAVFEILRQEAGSGSFSNFTRTVGFPLAGLRNTGLVATGTISEFGKCGSRTRNFTAASVQVVAGHGVTFRVVFPRVPASITFTPQSNSAVVPTPGADNITVEGFGFFMTATAPANTDVFWWGTYAASA